MSKKMRYFLSQTLVLLLLVSQLPVSYAASGLSGGAETLAAAKASPSEYTVTVAAGVGGSVTKDKVEKVSPGTAISVDGDQLQVGETALVVALSDTGYQFLCWEGVPDSGTVTENITVTASFEEKKETYTVSFKMAPSGQHPQGEVIRSQTVASGSKVVYDGPVPVRDADANCSYRFKGWIVNKDPSKVYGLRDEIEVNRTMDITAQFYADSPARIAASFVLPGQSGQITYFEKGSSVELPSPQVPDETTFVGWASQSYTSSDSNLKLTIQSSPWTADRDTDFTALVSTKKTIGTKAAAVSAASAAMESTVSDLTLLKKGFVAELKNNEAAKTAPEGIASAISEDTYKKLIDPDYAQSSSVCVISELKILLTDITAPDVLTGESISGLQFEVTPQVQILADGTMSNARSIENSELNGSKITFRLPIPSVVTKKYARIDHAENGKTVTYYCDIVTENEEKYTSVSVSCFSTFDVTFTDTKPSPSPSPTPSGGGGGGGGSSSTVSKIVAGWKQDTKGWWYLNANGTYPANCWAEIANPFAKEGQEAKSWYHFDASGYMQTGWFTDTDGKKYYLNPVSDGTLGRMFHGICVIDGVTYQFSESHDGGYGHLIK